MLLVLSNKGKGMQSSSEQPLVGEEHCVTTRITPAKETNKGHAANQKVAANKMNSLQIKRSNVKSMRAQ